MPLRLSHIQSLDENQNECNIKEIEFKYNKFKYSIFQNKNQESKIQEAANNEEIVGTYADSVIVLENKKISKKQSI